MVSPACLPPAVLIFLSCDADKVQTPPRATPAVRPRGGRPAQQPSNARTSTTPTNLERSPALDTITNLTLPWCC